MRTWNIKVLKKNSTKRVAHCIMMIISSAVLDVYGLRESQDLDYLHKTDLNVNINNISPHKDKWLSYYYTHKHDIIYNPENHFYFNGFKFATLDFIKK